MFDHFGLAAPFYESFIHPGVPEKTLEQLSIPAGAFVLDAGGGTGRVAQFLRGQAAQVVVVDQSFKMLREAHKKEGLNTACSDTERMPFRDNIFDRILMLDALHHVVNQLETINELCRILAPGGRIVIEEPDIRAFGVKLLALAEKLALMRSHFLSPHQIASLVDPGRARVKIVAEDSTAWVIINK